MNVSELERWLDERSLSARVAAGLLGVSAGALSNYRNGKQAISEKVARIVRGEDAESAVVEVVPDVLPEDLPPGTPGWRYRRGDVLPVGKYTEIFPKPVRYASGAVVMGIRWGSNGVGAASMQLIGTTKGYESVDHVHGYYPLPKGGIQSMTPANPAAMNDDVRAGLGMGNEQSVRPKGETKAKRGKVTGDLLDELP